MAQKMEQMAAKLAEMQARANIKNHKNNNKDNMDYNQHPQQNQVQFDENANQYMEAGLQHEPDNEAAQDDQFQQGTFLLDSAAHPSHVNQLMTKTNTLRHPLHVSTPNGTYSVTESSPVVVRIPAGPVHTDALVNRSMSTSLISPIPIIEQHGPIVLTENNASILPQNHPLTPKVRSTSIPIANVRNGIYHLITHPKSKTAPSAYGAFNVPKPKPRKTPKPSRPVETVIIPTSGTKKRKSSPIGVALPRPKQPNLKLNLDKRQRKLAFDYHLLYNHASPSTIMKTLQNPALQFDPSNTPSTTHAPMHCSPCRDAKLKTAPHYRRQHNYKPGEAISSDVAGPLNYKGQRLDDAYFGYLY